MQGQDQETALAYGEYGYGGNSPSEESGRKHCASGAHSNFWGASVSAREPILGFVAPL